MHYTDPVPTRGATYSHLEQHTPRVPFSWVQVSPTSTLGWVWQDLSVVQISLSLQPPSTETTKGAEPFTMLYIYVMHCRYAHGPQLKWSSLTTNLLCRLLDISRHG